MEQWNRSTGVQEYRQNRTLKADQVEKCLVWGFLAFFVREFWCTPVTRGTQSRWQSGIAPVRRITLAFIREFPGFSFEPLSFCHKPITLD